MSIHIYYYTKKKEVDHRMKYIFLSDIEYLIRNKKKIIILLILFPAIISAIMPNHNLNEMLYVAFGINLNFKIIDIIEIMMFIFNIVIYLYITFDIYTKDIQFELDNIFLRMRPQEWLCRKNIVFIFLNIILKLIEYLFVLVIGIIIEKEINLQNLISYYFCDLTYILLIEFISINIYILILSKKNINIIISLLLITIIILLSKNVISMYKYIGLSVLGIILLNVLINISIKNNSKMIIEKTRR